MLPITELSSQVTDSSHDDLHKSGHEDFKDQGQLKLPEADSATKKAMIPRRNLQPSLTDRARHRASQTSPGHRQTEVIIDVDKPEQLLHDATVGPNTIARIQDFQALVGDGPSPGHS